MGLDRFTSFLEYNGRALSLSSCSLFYKLKIAVGSKSAAFCVPWETSVSTGPNRPTLHLGVCATSPEASEGSGGLQPGSDHPVLHVPKPWAAGGCLQM